ncbi:hypothetical protein A2Z67_02140 [Candidatus Woesebacteria bacterium RBG_13_36_22]|uniref:Uncharacterized protein n=1 Tax=Candidatus Woesebacteria bacterium RBG_13_36_22 TaxID=1802478 RepID=A0A1F7X2A9_9BACT|nr:MAG: hypothetical protein A2Z67_02140 [Candidatus Woesebacteria bacterium RBG_13_36_22]
MAYSGIIVPMNREYQSQDLKNIILKPKDYLIPNEASRGIKFPDRIIPVKPLDDVWLASPERDWEEIDQVIEGRITGFQLNWLHNEGITIPQARLLSYTDMLKEQQLLQRSSKNRIDKLKQEFEDEKLDKKVYLRNKLYQKKFAPEINLYTQELHKEQKITNLILRKGVMDMFLPTGEASLPIGILPSITEDLPEAERGDVKNLFNQMANYLQETKDQELFAKYHYRNSPNIVKKHTDVQVLVSALDLTLNADYEDLAKSYFVFLKNRSNQMSEIGKEQFPKLSLLYDTLTAAFASSRTKILQNVGPQIIEEIYAPMLSNKNIGWEVDRLVNIHKTSFNSVKDFSEVIGDNADNYFAMMGFLPADKIPQPIEKILSKDGFRLEEGLVNILNVPDNLDIGGLDKQVPTVNKIIKLFAEKNSKAMGRYTEEEFGKIRKINAYMMMLPQRQANDKLGIEEDLYVYLLHHQKNVYDRSRPGPESGLTTESWRKERQKIIDNRKIFVSGQEDENILVNYFLYNWSQEKDKSIQKENQNELLGREITDKSIWFVSPRGDRFSSERDDELREKEISSIIFHPDAKYPREHRITMKLNGGFEPIHLWLDTNGKLLKGDRTSLVLDTAYYQILTNMVLKRLYVITSGILSTPEDQDMSMTEADRFPIAWRRAHYRIYKAGSRYTMQSGGAQEHAKEILHDYGIDIYKEIKRRQDIGTLLPNQVLTFVKEIAPKLPDGQEDKKPNELPFNPAWIPYRI